jgi:hypothetical protein
MSGATVRSFSVPIASSFSIPFSFDMRIGVAAPRFVGWFGLDRRSGSVHFDSRRDFFL